MHVDKTIIFHVREVEWQCQDLSNKSEDFGEAYPSAHIA